MNGITVPGTRYVGGIAVPSSGEVGGAAVPATTGLTNLYNSGLLQQRVNLPVVGSAMIGTIAVAVIATLLVMRYIKKN